MTQYSQKDGKFTATVTRDDGTTYTFMGTANGFQDPYEVFRKAFQDKTGEDLQLLVLIVAFLLPGRLPATFVLGLALRLLTKEA
jgi:hypothetical protein